MFPGHVYHCGTLRPQSFQFGSFRLYSFRSLFALWVWAVQGKCTAKGSKSMIAKKGVLHFITRMVIVQHGLERLMWRWRIPGFGG